MFDYIYDAKFRRRKSFKNTSKLSTELVLRRLKNPHLNYPCVHITGTNGKTTTARLLGYLLRRLYSLKVGVFTSPHITSWQERIEVNGEKIDDSIGYHLFKKIRETGVTLTYFETLTVLAFLYFSKMSVDIAVIEVGLGGTFDSTNVLSSNCIAVILTTIALDHVEVLGNNLLSIAQNKASLIKPYTPVIIQKQQDSVYQHIVERAARTGSPLFSVCGIEEKSNLENLSIGISDNLTTAYQTIGKVIRPYLRLDKIQLDTIKEKSYLFDNCGRFERKTLEYESSNLDIVMDIAHNPNALGYLLDNLRNSGYNPAVFCIAIKNGKDVYGFLNTILNSGLAAHIIVTSANSSCYFSESLLDTFECKNMSLVRDGRFALDIALKSAYKIGCNIVVTGSFAAVSLAHTYLKKHTQIRY